MSEEYTFVVLDDIEGFWERYMPAKVVDDTIEPLVEIAFRNLVDAYRAILKEVDVDLACLSPRPVQSLQWEKISPTASRAYLDEKAEELGPGMLGWGNHEVKKQPENLRARVAMALGQTKMVMEYFVLLQGENDTHEELYRGTSENDSWKAVFEYTKMLVPELVEGPPIITKDWSQSS